MAKGGLYLPVSQIALNWEKACAANTPDWPR